MLAGLLFASLNLASRCCLRVRCLAMDQATVREEDHVMLKKGDNLRIFQVHRNRDVYLEKSKFKMDNVIGQPYGSLFEVKDGQMVKIQREVNKETDTTDEGRDNRHLQDSDSNQRLKQEEIEQMKRDGISGDHLIEQLIENSATFQTKTGYAQEKWVKKKKKKHLLQYTVLKPTTRLMCEMHWSKGPSRILNLRIDSLAQILTLGNVRANSTVMVVESCLGLITAGVLERLGGYGKVISFYHGDSPISCNLDNYDFSKEIMDTLYNFPLELVNSLKHTSTEQQLCSSNSEQTENKEDTLSVETNDTAVLLESKTGSSEHSEIVKSELVPNNSEVETGLTNPATNGDQSDKDVGKGGKWNKKRNKAEKKKNRAEKKIIRTKEIEIARKTIQEKNIDCLIVASKFYPTPIVLALLDYVAPSRQVVVYSQFKEALTDCYTYLREYKGLVSYRLTETWLREYQVLPDRTHPVIQMSGTGGYILTATTVIKPTT